MNGNQFTDFHIMLLAVRQVCRNLPGIFRIDGALLDRFHGFIKGWDIPQVNDGMKICGWALNSEYFCTIMHLLREDISYSEKGSFRISLIKPPSDLCRLKPAVDLILP